MHHARRTAGRVRLRPFMVLLVGLSLAGSAMFAVGGAPDDGGDARGSAVLDAARAHLGEPYTWGGNGPATWDCSGLTATLWRSVGGVADIPRVADQQQAWAVPIPREQALLGDLVFFGEPVSHVGIVSGTASSGLTMVDASSSRGGVVERAVWTSDVVRFGRVPRAGMPVVTPWTPPPPPVPTPVTDARTAAVGPAAASSPFAAASPSAGAPVPSVASVASAAPAPPVVSGPPTGGLLALQGLPTLQRGASSAVAAAAAHLASTVAGATTFTDVSLVQTAWRSAGGRPLPADRSRLVGLARRVALRDARVGDLVVYGVPAVHLGVYVGGGQMVDASKVMGRVVLRTVYASASVRLVRLPG